MKWKIVVPESRLRERGLESGGSMWATGVWVKRGPRERTFK